MNKNQDINISVRNQPGKTRGVPVMVPNFQAGKNSYKVKITCVPDITIPEKCLMQLFSDSVDDYVSHIVPDAIISSDEQNVIFAMQGLITFMRADTGKEKYNALKQNVKTVLCLSFRGTYSPAYEYNLTDCRTI